MNTRAYGAVLAAAAIALGAVACGDEDEPDNDRPSGEPQVTLDEGKAAAVAAIRERPAAKPNLLGGDAEIGRLLARLDASTIAFYHDVLAGGGSEVAPPHVEREPGPCDGAQVAAGGYPRWCSAEKKVFEPTAGSDAVRQKDGALALYLMVGWAHAQAAGAGLGWEDAVKKGTYTEQQVKAAEFCLFGAFFRYLNYQGIIEESDFAAIDPVVNNHPAFANKPAGYWDEFNKGSMVPEKCVS